MNLPKRLRIARERAGLSARFVAEQAGCSEVTWRNIIHWEHGHGEPTISQLLALAKVYRRSLAWFLEEGEPPPDAKVLWCGKEGGA